MATPARKYDERDPRAVDPALDPHATISPASVDPRIAANDPYVNNQVVTRGAGNGVIIAAVLLVLAVVAFFIFGPGVGSDAVVTDQPAVTEPVAPAPDATVTPAPNAMAPAPDATAPAAPADPAAPAPDASAPTTAPTGEATPTAPAAPAQPAPAQ